MNKFLLSSGILCGVGALFIFISLAGPWLGDNDNGIGPTAVYSGGQSYDREGMAGYDSKEEAAIAMIVLGGLVGIVGLVLAILIVLGKLATPKGPLIVAGLGFALAVFALIAVALYASEKENGYDLGWAMFLAIFALIFGIVSGILAVVSTKKQ